MSLDQRRGFRGEANFRYGTNASASDAAEAMGRDRPVKRTAAFPSTRNDLPTLFIVERNAFFRDCLVRSLQNEVPGEIVACASLSEVTEAQAGGPLRVVLLSIASLTEHEVNAELQQLVDRIPGWRCLVLANNDDADAAVAALSGGANGYISTSTEFPIFIEALRFIAAGGTYVPPQYLLAARQTQAAPLERSPTGGITSRELAVIQRIRQGKPNKVIAYELNMCVSTVKVHVRHVMKKLHAHNRTEIAIMGAEVGPKLAHKANGAADNQAGESAFGKIVSQTVAYS